MQEGLEFDNFFVGQSFTDAVKFASRTWEIKSYAEKRPDWYNKPLIDKILYYLQGEYSLPVFAGTAAAILVTTVWCIIRSDD